MKKNGKHKLLLGAAFIAAFGVWTGLVQMVDVQPIGQKGTSVGFASFNRWFHRLTGVHWMLYTVTDWLGLVPVFVCILFAGVGLIQLIRRRSLFNVDRDILLLGGYYILVISGYLFFEMVPINYRPVLVEGVQEASYPSSTTLLVLSVMPTLWFQAERRLNSPEKKRWVKAFAVIFSVGMVVGRTLSGVHWFTDIVGAALLSAGLFELYEGAVLSGEKER